MSVYVDDMRRPARVGRISGRWSHLMADSHDELEAFARRLDLRRAIAEGLDNLEDWFEGTPRELDIGALTIETKRIPNGRISVSVTGDPKGRA